MLKANAVKKQCDLAVILNHVSGLQILDQGGESSPFILLGRPPYAEYGRIIREFPLRIWLYALVKPVACVTVTALPINRFHELVVCFYYLLVRSVIDVND